jgi:uncharacterized protein (UPF0147 family)
MRYSLPVVTVLVSSSLLNHFSHAAAAVGWRSDGTGLYPKANPVLEWSPTENVVWKTPLPEWGNSMPVLVSGKLFVNVEPDTLVCVSAAKGEILWKRPVKMEDTLTAEQRKKMEESRGEIEKLKAEMEDLNRQGLEMGRTIRRAADSERAALEQQRSELRERSDAIVKKLAEMGGVTEPPTHLGERLHFPHTGLGRQGSVRGLWHRGRGRSRPRREAPMDEAARTADAPVGT